MTLRGFLGVTVLPQVKVEGLPTECMLMNGEEGISEFTGTQGSRQGQDGFQDVAKMVKFKSERVKE